MNCRGVLTGAALKKWRMGHAWTQQKAADMLSMPFDTYKNYEQDKRPIPGVVKVAMDGLDGDLD